MKIKRGITYGAIGMISITVIATSIVACGTNTKSNNQHNNNVRNGANEYIPTEKEFDYSMFDNLRRDLSSSGADAYTQYWALKTELPNVGKGFTFRNKINYDGNSFSETTTKFMRNGVPKDIKEMNIVAKSGKYALIYRQNDEFVIINAETLLEISSLTIKNTDKLPITGLSFDGTTGYITTSNKVYDQNGKNIDIGISIAGITQYMKIGDDSYLVAKGKLYKNSEKLNISANVNSIYHDGTQILIATDNGYIPNANKINEIVNSVPNRNIKQILKTSDGHYWFATTQGVFESTKLEVKNSTVPDSNTILQEEYEGKGNGTVNYKSPFNYYSGERWLLGDEIIDIAEGWNKTLNVLTNQGYSKIMQVQTTMEKKVGIYEKSAEVNSGRATGLSKFWIDRNPDDKEMEAELATGNDGLWTSMEIIGEIRRARTATNDKEEFNAAKQSIFRQFNGLKSLFAYVGPDAIDSDGNVHKDALAGGMPSRSIISVEDVEKSPKGEGISGNPEWVISPVNDKYYIKVDTSSDSLIAIYAAFWEFYNYFGDSEDKEMKVAAKEAADILLKMANTVLKNNLSYRDLNYNVTTWARFNPTYINFYPEMVGDRKLNSGILIFLLQAALQIATDSNMSQLSALGNEQSINPEIKGQVEPKSNYAFALSKLLSDYDAKSYEEGEDALFQQEYFYRSLLSENANEEYKTDRTIMDLKDQALKNPKNKKEEVGVFDFWRYTEGAGYFDNVVYNKDKIKHYTSAESSITEEKYENVELAKQQLYGDFHLEEDNPRAMKNIVEDAAYDADHPTWHNRPADTFLANEQSFNTMSNENNVSDDEEYLLLYPGLMESSEGIYSKINDNSGASSLNISKVSNDQEYSDGMTDTAMEAYNYSKDYGLPVWNYVSKVAGNPVSKENKDFASKIFLQSFPMDLTRFGFNNSNRKDLIFNDDIFIDESIDLGDPSSNPKTPNAAWGRRYLLSAMPSGEGDPSLHNGNSFDDVFMTTERWFSPVGSIFLIDYYSSLL